MAALQPIKATAYCPYCGQGFTIAIPLSGSVGKDGRVTLTLDSAEGVESVTGHIKGQHGGLAERAVTSA